MDALAEIISVILAIILIGIGVMFVVGLALFVLGWFTLFPAVGLLYLTGFLA